MSIHTLGGFGCTSELHPNVRKSYDRCQKNFVPVNENVNRPPEENVNRPKKGNVNRPDKEGDDDIKPYVLLQVPEKLKKGPN